MNALIWNARGLGSDQAFRVLLNHPEPDQRRRAWTLLKRLNDMYQFPWVCAGDFNEVLSNDEKLGIVKQKRILIKNFQEALDYCDLSDMGFRGPIYTWSNKRDGSESVQESLDRGVCNLVWKHLFPRAVISNLEYWHSDHRALLIVMFGQNERDKEDIRQLIEQNWFSSSNGDGLQGTISNITQCTKAQKAWNRSNRGNLTIEIENKRNELRMATSQSTSDLFRSNQGSDHTMNKVLDTVQPRISPQRSSLLDRAFIADEVRLAVFAIAPNKAPGIDGLSGFFYQKFWDVVGQRVTADCLRYLNEGCSLEAINHTLVALIPKVKSPVKMVDFRPISLCNLIYKVVAKALVNRLRLVLNEVISDS
ncbi:hypothetical protein Dsin_027752 [Dipteronia sinensis]|uniref:Reverse transcriptase n=1 Tax=Dipteronia sinensis TaxID=43782 RepID=A0AAD9ZQR0_9ROSI|nr:hypothetical protein Dsin_027752 [Dipteronia sinensis]